MPYQTMLCYTTVDYVQHMISHPVYYTTPHTSRARNPCRSANGAPYWGPYTTEAEGTHSRSAVARQTRTQTKKCRERLEPTLHTYAIFIRIVSPIVLVLILVFVLALVLAFALVLVFVFVLVFVLVVSKEWLGSCFVLESPLGLHFRSSWPPFWEPFGPQDG